MSSCQSIAVHSQLRARGQISPGQTDWPFVAQESCSWGMPPQNTLVVCSRTLEIESPELALSQPWHINTTSGGISHGIFCNHSNVSFPIVCQPLLEPQLSKQQQTRAAFPPGSHSALLLLPLHAGKLALVGDYRLGQGIRSVSQLVKQVSGGNTGFPQPTPLGRQSSGPSLWYLSQSGQLIITLLEKKSLPQIQRT